jgi:hypothetical protein
MTQATFTAIRAALDAGQGWALAIADDAGADGDQRANGLHVRVPPARGAAVGVGHRLAEAGPLAADVAHAGHGELLRDLVRRARRRMLAGQPRQCSQRAEGPPNGPDPYPRSPGAAVLAPGEVW